MKIKKDAIYYTIQQCADLLAVDYRFIYDRVITGEIPSKKFAKKVIRVPKTGFHAWMNDKQGVSINA